MRCYVKIYDRRTGKALWRYSPNGSYDTRNLLVPSALSEGGRRLYSEEDLQRMKMICFLRDLGMSLHAISRLLAEEQQEALLREEIGQKQNQLLKLQQL